MMEKPFSSIMSILASTIVFLTLQTISMKLKSTMMSMLNPILGLLTQMSKKKK